MVMPKGIYSRTIEQIEQVRQLGLNSSGSNHPAWKGEDVKYQGLHNWVRKNLGKTSQCTQCDSTSNVYWANISHVYKRDLNDYFQLCSKCHYKYDWASHVKRNGRWVKKGRDGYA